MDHCQCCSISGLNSGALAGRASATMQSSTSASSTSSTIFISYLKSPVKKFYNLMDTF